MNDTREMVRKPSNVPEICSHGQPDRGQGLPQESSGSIPLEEARATVSMCGSLVAAILAAIYYGARLGFRDNFVEPVVQTLGLSWFLIHFPFGYRLLRQGRSQGHRELWCEGDGALTLFGLGLVTFCGVLAGRIRWSPDYLLAALGAALLAYRSFCWLRAGGRVRTALFLGSTGLLALYAAAVIWGNGYQNPLFIHTLGGVGMGGSAIDTVFHAAYCNMIRTYGVPSTGLDGVPFIAYHFGSHWLFAQLCNLLNLSAVDFYNLGYPVVFIPFYFNSLLLFAINLRPRRAPGEVGGPAALRGNLLLWFLLLVAHIGVLPYHTGRFEAAITWDLPIVSESYSTAVSISLLGLSAALSLFKEIRCRLNALKLHEALALAVVFPTWLGILGLFKISLMLILLAVAMCACLRLGLYRNWRFVVFLALAILGSALSCRLTLNPAYRGYLGASRPFGFIRENVSAGWLPYFFPLYFLWVWVYAFLRLRQQRVDTISGFIAALKERTIVDVELVVAVALVGALPGMLVGTQANMSAYFSDYQGWLAWGLVVGSSVVWREASVRPAPTLRAAIRDIRLSQLFAVAIGLCVLGSMLLTTYTLTRRMIAGNLATRRAGQPDDQVREPRKSKDSLTKAFRRADLASVWNILRQRAAAAEGRLEQKRTILTVLRALDHWPLSEKRRTVLYIPKANRAFWGFFDRAPPDIVASQGSFGVKLVPLLAPALSGIAMIDGLPLPHTIDWGDYGYEGYRIPDRAGSQPPLESYAAELSKRAARMGFAQVLALDIDQQGQIHSILLPCNPTFKP